MTDSPTRPHDQRRTNGANATGFDGQTVLVFQGGGALGAYQAGVYQALSEAGVEPDWIIGTSIGAINAALVVGNSPDVRLAALEEFWRRMASRPAWGAQAFWPQLSQTLAYWRTITGGISGFFEPNAAAFLGPHVPLGTDRAGYYSTAPLDKTLKELIDFDRLNEGRPRLTVGAAHVRTSRMTYFDSRAMRLDARHIMASGALPPAFPAVRIDGELYWDGGILSNTPSEVVFDDHPRSSSLIFAVHMWHPQGPEPVTIWDVLHRQKEIQYSSRIASHVARQQQTHRLRHVIQELAKHVPTELRSTAAVRELEGHGCLTSMHVVRLLSPRLDHEDQSKDVDFSADGIRSRWTAGIESTRRALAEAPWRGTFDPLDGVILHEIGDSTTRSTAPAVQLDVTALPECAAQPGAGSN